jgi:Rod binding domain-containing protein
MEDLTMNSLGSISPTTAMPVSDDLQRLANPRQSPEAVGQAFESMLASMVIKQMRQTLDGETMFGKDSGDVMGGLFDQMLGDHLGKTGSFGVSAMIRKQLERRGAAS